MDCYNCKAEVRNYIEFLQNDDIKKKLCLNCCFSENIVNINNYKTIIFLNVILNEPIWFYSSNDKKHWWMYNNNHNKLINDAFRNDPTRDTQLIIGNNEYEISFIEMEQKHNSYSRKIKKVTYSTMVIDYNTMFDIFETECVVGISSKKILKIF